MKISFGRLQGLVCLGVGLLVLVMGIIMMICEDFVFVIFASFPVFIFLGLSMIIFPGVNVPASEVNGEFKLKDLLDSNKNQERNKRQMEVMNAAPKGHQIAWIIGGILGLFLTVVLMVFLMGTSKNATGIYLSEFP
jgi:hypothetical protein